MEPQGELAAWLLGRRSEIEKRLGERLDGRMPGAASAESEALRRFRSFAVAALRRGKVAAPSLDGLRPDVARTEGLLESWCESAAALAGPRSELLRGHLGPLLARFRTALRASAPSRQASGPPRTGRRAVTAAIDRVPDAFLAIDVDSRKIVDTNPAAGSLLGVERNALIATDAFGFVPEAERGAWAVQLDAVAEGTEPDRFHSRLVDVRGGTVEVEARVSRYATRERTLALVLARPLA